APADEEKPPPPAAAAPATDKTEKQSDKDLAREAWRRNKPDLSVDGPRASLLIPLKGSSEGSSFTVTNNPRAVVVKLPQAASMITMRLYKIEREGFRLVRINQAEKDANPEDGSELKDDFVRITVRRPSAPLPGGAATEKPSAADRNDGDQSPGGGAPPSGRAVNLQPGVDLGELGLHRRLGVTVARLLGQRARPQA